MWLLWKGRSQLVEASSLKWPHVLHVWEGDFVRQFVSDGRCVRLVWPVWSCASLVHVNVYIFYFEQLFLLCFALFSQAAETVSLLAQCTEYWLTHVLPEEDVFFSIAAVTVITILGTGLSITGCFSCICTQTLPVVFSFLCRNPPRSCKPPWLWFPVLDSQVERSVSIDLVVNPVCRSYISLLVIQDQCGGLWAAEQSCSVEDLLFCLSYHNTIC